MTDMMPSIAPKSDQLNFDDLIGGIIKTIKITDVSIGKHEQPVAIKYEGDNGKPYKPCKSMCRVLVQLWGADANKYIGRSLTLYGDPNVVFGGAKVGGIRISHMSDISEPVTMALTATRASRKPFTVKPLKIIETVGAGYTGTDYAGGLDDALHDISIAPTLEGLKFKHDEAVRKFKSDDERKKIIAAKDKRKKELTTQEPNNANTQ